MSHLSSLVSFKDLSAARFLSCFGWSSSSQWRPGSRGVACQSASQPFCSSQPNVNNVGPVCLTGLSNLLSRVRWRVPALHISIEKVSQRKLTSTAISRKINHCDVRHHRRGVLPFRIHECSFYTACVCVCVIRGEF